MIYIDNEGITDPHVNLAIEEHCIRHLPEGEDYLLFYINAPTKTSKSTATSSASIRSARSKMRRWAYATFIRIQAIHIQKSARISGRFCLR
ncbi:MAG: hypothetical protein L0I84_04260 [Halomonas subglaciescola]|nr:hypothetical protein [Halomonas subglaciescola]